VEAAPGDAAVLRQDVYQLIGVHVSRGMCHYGDCCTLVRLLLLHCLNR
jgi:hypothetical protein